MDAFSIFEKEARDVIQIYNEMTLSEEDDCPILLGTLNLNDENGVYQDSYQIKIKPKDSYPLRFPYVFEVGGRIPRNVDWHIFEGEGNFCIASQPEEILVCNNGLTLLGFIENQIKPYLYNQTFRYKYGYFLNERSHGDKGWIEFFEDELKTNNIKNIIFVLSFILERNPPDRRSKCFCDSEKKFRNCHKEAYNKLSIFSDLELAHYIKRFKELYGIV